MSVHATANGEFHFRLPITCFLNCCYWGAWVGVAIRSREPFKRYSLRGV